MLTSHCRLRHVTDTFLLFCEGDRPTGIRRGKRLHFAFETHHHDKHRGEVQRGSIRLYMHRVGKVVPPKRHILKNISLVSSLGQKLVSWV